MKKLRVIIVSPPGTWQRVLQRNIEAFPSVKVIEVVSGSLTATQLVKELSPDIIVIDSTIPIDDAIALVQKIKNENHETRSIVITDTTQEERRIIRAGADYTISTFDYETQISAILNHLTSSPNGLIGSEIPVQTNPGPSL